MPDKIRELKRAIAADPELPGARERLQHLERRYSVIKRIAIISDIHGNLEALNAVLADIRTQSCDKIFCLGDLVNYGADPQACVDLVRQHCDLTILGNHDAAAIGLVNIDYFGAYAKESVLWTRKVLKDHQLQYLASLPLLAYYEDMTLVHGTLSCPELFDYIQTTYDAYLSLQLLETQVCFLGHSHVPITFFQMDQIGYTLNSLVKVEDAKMLVNVGSVGQPRDDNPLASYAIYDMPGGEIEIRRVGYDVERAREKILRAGLPEALGERLKYGR